MIAYNVQSAVDTQNHLIVAHEVTNIPNDRGQLSSMATQARSAMGVKAEFTVLADKGYFKGEDILACHEAGMTPYVPKPLTSNNKANGLFDKRDFIYDADRNEYRCPAGQSLPYRFTNIEQGKTLHAYWSSNCQSCAIKQQCTPSKTRRVRRWEHEAVLENMQERLDTVQNAMLIRKQTVEHPFGTIKSWMGATHFLTKSLDRVSAEMSLHVLAYNLKRVIQILGAKNLMQAMTA
jgi:hypothetical protein